MCFTVKKNVKHPPSAAGSASSGVRQSVHERGDDEMPSGLLALAVGLDVVTILEVLVDHLALQRAHRFKRDGATIADGALGGLISGRPERLRPAFPVAGGIDDHRLAVAVATRGDPVGEMLNGIDRLAMVADEQAVTKALGPQVDTDLGGTSPRDPLVVYYNGQVNQFVHKR